MSAAGPTSIKRRKYRNDVYLAREGEPSFANAIIFQNVTREEGEATRVSSGFRIYIKFGAVTKLVADTPVAVAA